MGAHYLSKTDVEELARALGVSFTSTSTLKGLWHRSLGRARELQGRWELTQCGAVPTGISVADWHLTLNRARSQRGLTPEAPDGLGRCWRCLRLPEKWGDGPCQGWVWGAERRRSEALLVDAQQRLPKLKLEFAPPQLRPCDSCGASPREMCRPDCPTVELAAELGCEFRTYECRECGVEFDDRPIADDIRPSGLCGECESLADEDS